MATALHRIIFLCREVICLVGLLAVLGFLASPDLSAPVLLVVQRGAAVVLVSMGLGLMAWVGLVSIIAISAHRYHKRIGVRPDRTRMCRGGMQ